VRARRGPSPRKKVRQGISPACSIVVRDRRSSG
jgi:hypothetical protein